MSQRVSEHIIRPSGTGDYLYIETDLGTVFIWYKEVVDLLLQVWRRGGDIDNENLLDLLLREARR